MNKHLFVTTKSQLSFRRRLLHMTENLPVELLERLAKADALHFGIRQIARDGAHLIHHARPRPGRHRAQLITRRLVRRVSSGDYFQEHFFSLAPF